jgi:hypothetical protein
VKVAEGISFPAIRLTATASNGQKTVSNVIYSGDYRGGNESSFSIPLLEGEYRITAELPAARGVIESLMYGFVNLKSDPIVVRFPTQTLLITIGKQ